jgi:hypothetical protein
MNTADQTAKRLDQILKEHCDGYVLVAFDPGSGEPIIACEAKDIKTRIALTSILSGIMCQGGVDGLLAQLQRKNNPPPNETAPGDT